MKIKTPDTKIPVMFQNLKSYKSTGDRFTQVKLWLMHTGVNHNYSSFDKEVVNKAIPTLANTPILAFIEENDDGNLDYSDHRMVLELNSDDEVKMRYLGSAIGVIPEDNNAKWETRLSDDGEELSYLTVEALLWNKWDDPVDILRERGTVSQSMELSDSFTGHWDKEGVFHFESFEFFGACLLGEGVMPAMKNSTAEIQFSESNSIKKTIETKLEEFNTLFTAKGGEKMTKETERDYEKTKVSHEDEEEVKDKKKLFEDEGDDSGDESADDDNDTGEDSEGEEDGDNEGETDPEPEEGNDDDGGEEEPEPEPEPEVDTSELENLVNSSDYNSDDYTGESFEAYDDALSNANNVLGDAEASQEDVNNALQGLQDAINGLDEKPQINKGELEASIASAEGYQSQDYTEDSFNALTQALESARGVMNDEEATQQQVDDAKNTLQSAIDQLQEKANKSDLQALVETVSSYSEEDYTKDSFSVLQQEISSANTVLGDDNATQQQVDSARNALQSAIDQLQEVASKDSLQSLVDSAETKDEELYTEDSFNALQQAISAARGVLANDSATQQEVDAEQAKLQSAIDNLEERAVEAEDTDDDNTSAVSGKPRRRKIESYEEGYSQLSKKLESVQQELEELRVYKRQREESDLKGRFSGQLSEEEFDKVFNTFSESSIEDIEKELFALVGKKNFSLPKTSSKTNKIPLEMSNKNDDSNDPYGALRVYIEK